MRTLLINGRIHSPRVGDTSAMLVQDSTIRWLGSDPDVVRDSADRVIDVRGAIVIPAFVDAHFHCTDTGLALTGLDLSQARSLTEALSLVERHARASRGRPVLGSGWDDTTWPERRAPTAAEIDRASYGGVVYLSRVDAHSAVVSSALLAAMGDRSALVGDLGDGLLVAAAHHAARSIALAGITDGQRRDLQRHALSAAAAAGIAAVHEMAGPEISSAQDFAELLALADAEVLPEVYGYWGELGGIDQARELGAVGAGGDLFCDGSLGSRTAALSRPYSDSDTSGYLRYEADELVTHIRDCTRAGLQAGFHAIGDAAVAQVVEAVVRAGAEAIAAGHRVEHAEMIPDVQALATAGLVASVQPAFDAVWGGPDGMYAERLGPDRSAKLNPIGPLHSAGVSLAFGSDSPVTAIDPWAAVRAACSPSNPIHALSVAYALEAHTRGGWLAARAGADGSGLLEVGAPATFAIFAAEPGARAENLLTPSPVALPAQRTVLRGVVLFDSGELE